MKIAQIAPLHESVPPALYGGTERVVSYLTEELVRQGHDVTLFATADSRTDAELVPCRDRALRLDPHARDPVIPHMVMLERVAARAREFDVLHFHTDALHLSAARRLGRPCVTTLHGRLDLPDLPDLFGEFAEMPLVSISDAQREPVPWANWRATVHHGLPRDLLSPRRRRRDYLAFLGRISPEKGPDGAIHIAREARLPLKIAAKVDKADREYFDARIRPLIDRGGGVEFVGEVDERRKNDLLSGAAALLFPIDWPEPFGMVMIEAMACGTPVIAYPRGSVPEIVEHGVTGSIVQNEAQAVRAARAAADGRLPADRCRAAFERRFTADRMARDYVRVYESVMGGHGGGGVPERVHGGIWRPVPHPLRGQPHGRAGAGAQAGGLVRRVQRPRRRRAG